MVCVAWGTAFKRFLSINFPVSLQIPYVPFFILIKAFSKFEINPFIPFGVIYGFFIIFHAYLIIDFIKSSSKREKKDKWDFTELIFFYAPPILVLALLFFYPQ